MLTQANLKKILKYNPNTGVFTRLPSKNNATKAGDVSGYTNDQGYVVISVRCVTHRAHRLAFLYMEGYFPEYEVDHINGVRDDNRWINLRHVTRICNLQNRRTSVRNKSGFNGVTFYRKTGKWQARICFNHKEIHLGLHDTPLEAALARITAEDWDDRWNCDVRCENRMKVFSLLDRG